MNKILTLLATVFLLLTNPFLDSIHPPQLQNLKQFASYPSQAKQALNALNKLPEFHDLLERAQKDGPIQLKMESHPNFEGLWDGHTRSIVVNTRFNPSLGSMICTILFELHNANTAQYYDRLIELAQEGSLTKDQYVEKVERAEYQNAKNTHDLLEKGIRSGIFPESAHWPVVPDFEEHYKVQQISGHSIFIANNYDQINPRAADNRFKGTIMRPTWMDDMDRDDLCRYVMMRCGLEKYDEEMATRYRQDLKNEIERLKDAYLQNSSRAARRVELIKIAMKGNADFQAAAKDWPYLVS